MAPDPDAFRALARSSPWRFRTLHFTYRSRDAQRETVAQAWLARPGALLVIDDDGRRHVERGLPYTTSRLAVATFARTPWGRWRARRAVRRMPPPPEPVTPEAITVPLRPDGLVAQRPDRAQVAYDDPMWENYRWVAMLDPVELATGVDLSEVRRLELRGRATWVARAVAVAGYDPRCSCCPLLWGAQSEALLKEESGLPVRGSEDDFPDAYEVMLDETTGIVVELIPTGGNDTDRGFSNTIHEVDAPMAPELLS